METKDLKTGYFAHPERPEAEFPPVHAITTETLPLCGEAVPEGHEYQWCAGFLWTPIVDCAACLRSVARMDLAEGRKQLAIF